jgi:hypothetical protein
MRCAVVISEGVKQIMFTPENKSEKLALGMIDVDDDITVERKKGTFYTGFNDEGRVGYNVALCRGGYLRAYEDSESLMLVLKPKESDNPQ